MTHHSTTIHARDRPTDQAAGN